MKDWYCEVCGSIQGSEATCTTCGMHKDFLQSFSYTLDAFDETTRILIIGNGVAGFSLAKALRTLHCKCPISIFSKGNHTPYTYRKLNKDVLLDIAKTSIDTAWYEQHDVTFHQHVQITRIDTKKQEIYTQHQHYPYDILVLAMGCEHQLPQLSGNDLSQIYTMDALYDHHVLRKVMKPGRHGVLIGSDIQSIELACALADAHIQVDIIESLPHLMPQELNTIGSELLATYLTKEKIQIHTNCAIKEFHGISRVESVEFVNGRCINADFVICSGTLKMHHSFLLNSGIKFDKRIQVDQNMRTNIANIYACGSVSHTFHTSENNFLYARQQAMRIAFHILGQKPPFHQTMFPRHLKHDNFSLCLLGDIHNYDQHVEKFDDTLQSYEKYCYNENQCSGVLLVNRDIQIPDAIKHINDKQSFYTKR